MRRMSGPAPALACAGSLLLCVFLIQIARVSSFALSPMAVHGNARLRSQRLFSAASLQCAKGRPVSPRCAAILTPSGAAHTGHPTRSSSMTAPNLARRAWEHLAALLQVFLLKVAVLASLFAAVPMLAHAAPSSAADPAAVEAPTERLHTSSPKQTVRGILAFSFAAEQREDGTTTQDAARQFEEAESFSRERKNWLYSHKAQQVGMTLVSAASLAGHSHSPDSPLLVAKAEQLQQPNDHAAEAMRLTAAAASELGAAAKASLSKLAQQAPDLPAAIASVTPESAKQAVQQVRATADTVTVRVSDLLHEHDPSIKAVSAKLEAATSSVRAYLKSDPQQGESVAKKVSDAVTNAASTAAAQAPAASSPGDFVSSHGNVAASKSWSVFRGTEAFLAEEASKDSVSASHMAGDAFRVATPTSSQAELQARYPNWQKLTRQELLQMDFKHHHDGHEQEETQLQARDVMAKLVTPLTMAFGFIKLMFPLTMLSVPVIWVFPWELITSGFKSNRKFFNDAPGSKEEEQSANKAREKILWASTILNVIVSVIFGSGGGGGGHH